MWATPDGREGGGVLAGSVVSMLELDPNLATPLFRQIYNGLRALILAGQLTSGTRLPSTRALAATLGVARITVVNAYEELEIEGYLEATVGAGTYVSSSLPDDLLDARLADPGRMPTPSGSPRASRRGQLILATPVTNVLPARRPRAFRPGAAALELFPIADWRRLVARAWRVTPRDELLGYGPSTGYRPLCEAIATHLASARAVRCEPDQVIVVNGSQQGLDLAVRVLLDPGDGVWVENPSRMGAKAALLAAGARPIPVPVDAEGIDVERGVMTGRDARMAVVTPSHQYPLGVTLSLPRRLALLDWAKRSQAWILEDDYNSEYRYAGRPLPALQGLDNSENVIYLGTFSRSMFPAIRLGYLVVPPSLVDVFGAGRALLDRQSPTAHQVALAEFIDGGHYARHVRRMRTEYAARQAALVEAATSSLADIIELESAEAGMHLVGWLRPGLSDRAVESAAATVGVDVLALSHYTVGPPQRGGLLFGYAVSPPPETRRAIGRLARVLHEAKDKASS